MWRKIRSTWVHYLTIYILGLFVYWASLATLLATQIRYVSVLSWNLFGLEEVLRRQFGEAVRGVLAPATVLAAALVAILFVVAALIIHSPRTRRAGIVIAVLLGLSTVVWFTNPWENM